MRWHQGVTRGQWMALVAALLGWMFDGFEMGIVPPLARTMLTELLDLNEDARLARESDDPVVREEARRRVDGPVGLWNGRIVAAFLVGAAVGGWLFGWLGDRIGRVRAMIFSVLAYSLFTGLCGLAQSPWQLAVLRFIAALGMGGEWALGVALVMESWPARSRPVLAGLIGAASNVGFILAALLVLGLGKAGLQVADGGWRWMLGACAAPALVTFFIRMFVPESAKWEAAMRKAVKPGLAEILAPGLRRRTLMGAALGAVALIGTWGSVQWIPPWALRETHSQAIANYAQTFSGLGAVVGSFLGAVIGYRVGRRVAFFALAAGSLAICQFLFRYPNHFAGLPDMPWLFLGTVFLTGGLTASFYGWLPLYLPELFPTRLRATGQGFAFNAGRIVAAAGALGTGLLMQHAFQSSYALAGAAISLVYVAGMAIIWLAPETKGQPLPE